MSVSEREEVQIYQRLVLYLFLRGYREHLYSTLQVPRNVVSFLEQALREKEGGGEAEQGSECNREQVAR